MKVQEATRMHTAVSEQFDVVRRGEFGTEWCDDDDGDENGEDEDDKDEDEDDDDMWWTIVMSNCMFTHQLLLDSILPWTYVFFHTLIYLL